MVHLGCGLIPSHLLSKAGLVPDHYRFFFTLAPHSLIITHKKMCFWFDLLHRKQSALKNIAAAMITTGKSIFNFTTFISGLALFAIIYTTTDILYRFRISITSWPLHKLTFFFLSVIGIGTLVLDIWETIPYSSYLQGALGIFFVMLIAIWICVGYLYPPIFTKRNYKKFFNELGKVVFNGSDSNLVVIAEELARSVDSIVKLAKVTEVRNNKKRRIIKDDDVFHFSRSLILLMGNRRLCRHIINSHPATALIFFNAIKNNQADNLPVRTFFKNILIEALNNKDSILYHEVDEEFSGLIGQHKTFSTAMFDNYDLLTELDGKFSSFGKFLNGVIEDPESLSAYCRCILISFESYLHMKVWPEHSGFLTNAFDEIEHFLKSFTLGEAPPLAGFIVIDFSKKLIRLLSKEKTLLSLKWKVCIHDGDFYDYISRFVWRAILTFFEYPAADVSAKFHVYSDIWFWFFKSFLQDKQVDMVQKIIRYKLRRLIYTEIRFIEICERNLEVKAPSLLLGFCWKIMGFALNKEDRDIYPLHKMVLEWTKHHYLSLREKNLKRAEICLQVSGVKFDKKNSCLILPSFNFHAAKQQKLELCPRKSHKSDKTTQNIPSGFDLECTSVE